MSQSSDIDTTNWLKTFRHRIIILLLSTTSLLGTIGIVYLLKPYISEGGRFSTAIVAYFISYGLLLFLLIARWIPDVWRASGFLSLLYGFAVFSLYNGWLGGGGRPFLLSLVVLAAVLIGPRAGVLASFGSFFTFVFFGIAFHQGWIFYPLAPSFSDLSIIIVEGIGFAMALGMINIGLWFFAKALTTANQATMDVQNSRALLAEHAQELDETNRLLAERTQNLETANQELKTFAYSVSHDLRAPLRSIDSFSGILEEEHAEQLNDTGREFLFRIRKNVRNMDQLIHDLLEFSQLSRQPIKKQSVSPTTIAREVLSDFQSELESRKIEIVVHDLPPCQADPSLLRQVFINLISNAIKYTNARDDANIQVSCEEKNNETVYFVRDNGIGFDMQYADQIFGVFQRLHHQSEYEGTGIGLATVQRIIQRHGGKIWAEAEEGQGATFYFTLEKNQERGYD